MEEAATWAHKIADNSPLAILEMKRLFRHGLTQDFESHSHHVLMSVLNCLKAETSVRLSRRTWRSGHLNSRGGKRDRLQVAPKIVIIGAGSLEFPSRLTADCLSYPALAGAHFALVDTDGERLSYAGRIFDRIVEAGGYEASCSLHSEVTEALPGAQFVIVSILVGGYEAIEAEIDIPMKYVPRRLETP